MLLLVSASAVDKPKEPQFSYVAGTESVLAGCQGTLEVTSDALTFLCAQYSVHAPYDSISMMEYRADVSRTVRKMKLDWKLRPPAGGGKKNRYFTVVYQDGGTNHAIILQVAPDAMRPYLAEIDLKAGKRVDVQSHEEYE